jgi:DNA-binding GntR family transcriptional regulator
LDLRPPKLTERVTEVLRELILTGKIGVGQRVNEQALAQELRISRSPLREALSILSAEGLVEFVPGHGAYVTECNAETLYELAEVREILEGTLAGLAAKRADAKDKEQMGDLLRETAKVIRAQPESYPLELDFHSHVAQAAGNPTLASLSLGITSRLRLQLTRTGYVHDAKHTRQSLADHREIYKAICEGDGEAAERTMRKHVQEMLESSMLCGPGVVNFGG